ncbi:MAG: Error-prone repair protein ImuA [Chitinophagaceae bacterium]|nr:Error-prone repair protein ImuA [Chitinophagaceae bacterium]
MIAGLRQDILRMQGQRLVTGPSAGKVALGPVLEAFPGKIFPTGTVHECISATPSAAAAASGFIASILGSLMQNGGSCVWISPERIIFPPGLKSFGIEADRVLFIHLKKEKDICWAMEAALQVEGLAGVVGELSNLDFAVSRRLQLAVEKSGVTGFVVRHQPRRLHPTACVSRWQITSQASYHPDGIPGVGFPCWEVELQKIRGGKPGSWELVWMDGCFQELSRASVISSQAIFRKIG